MKRLKQVSSWGHHIPGGVEFTPGDLTKNGSLARCWARVLGEDPDKELFFDSSGKSLSRGDLLLHSEKVANAMHRRGLGRGDRVILSCTTSLGMVVHYVAALRLGLVVVPMNVAYTESEVSHIVESVRPSAAVVDSLERAAWIVEAASRAVSRGRFVGPGEELPVPKPNLEVFMASENYDEDLVDDLLLDEAVSETPALIAYTSGTTGKPKGAILTHGNLLASAKSLNLAWRWQELDRLVLALPLFHMHGLGVGLNGTLCAGSSAVLLEKFDPLEVFRAIEKYSATMFFGVPTMYQRFLEGGSLKQLALLRLMVSGSAPMSKEVHRAIEKRTGTTVLERYGTTESLIDISNPHDGGRIPGKVGFPLPGVEVALEEEREELFISGPTVFRGYLNDPKATESAFPFGGGWFATGDAAEVDGSGYIAIVGRLKDLIISGGYNVYPKEVEEALLTHDAVKDCAVVGVESQTWGEEVVAFVVRSRDVSEGELIGYASKSLANYKRPKRIMFVDRFPRNALGKVVYSELRSALSLRGAAGE